jgi:uncharacterized membrane protein HdeD (DUF308 family)
MARVWPTQHDTGVAVGAAGALAIPTGGRTLPGMAAVVERMSRRAWPIAATRGGLAIVVGVILLTRPGMTLAALFAMLGSYLFFDGALALFAAFRGMNAERSRMSLCLEGIVSVGVGILAFVHPATMKLALLALIATRSIITGIVEFGGAVSERRVGGQPSGFMWLAGLASVAFGIFLVARPASGVMLLAWLAGIYALVFGVGLVATAFRLRRVARASAGT